MRIVVVDGSLVWAVDVAAAMLGATTWQSVGFRPIARNPLRSPSPHLAEGTRTMEYITWY